MTRISKLSLKNFKSFRKADIPISDGFTVIAGSNGSGKSNILDSLMFSLGITSLKALRATRLTDLVNATAEENYAKVELFIKSDRGDFTVSRMIDRQGKGIYRLNDEKKTLGEISSLLNELGISANGHNIVVQGDITRVIEMSPEERRGIVDEAAGIREFDEKKQEAIKELSRVDEKIKDCRIVLNEREAYLQELERERLAALEFEALEDERKRTHATLLFLEKEKAETKIQSVREEQAKLMGERSAYTAEAGSLKEELISARAETARLNSELLSHSEKTFRITASRLENEKSERRVLEERMFALEQAIRRGEQEIQSLEHQKSELFQAKDAGEAHVLQAREKLPVLQREFEKLNAEKKGLEGRQASEQERRHALENELENARKQHQLAREEQLRLQGEKNALENEVSHVRESLSSLSLEISSLDARIEIKRQKQKELHLLGTGNNAPETRAHSAERDWVEAVEKEKEAFARIRAHLEWSELLESAHGKCPICDHVLSDSTKKTLLESKRAHLKELEDAKANSQKATVNARKEFDAALERLEKAKALAMEIADLIELETQSKELRDRIKNLRELPLEQQLIETEKALKAIEQKEKNAQDQRRTLEIQWTSSRAENVVSDFFQASNRAAEAGRILLGLEQQVSEWVQKEKPALEARIAEIDERKKNRANEQTRWKTDLAGFKQSRIEIDGRIGVLEQDLAAAEHLRKKLAEDLVEAEKAMVKRNEKLENLQSHIAKNERKENELAIEMGKLEVRLSDIENEFAPLQDFPRIQNAQADLLHKRLPEIEKRLRELGAINQRAIESFNLLKNEMEEISTKLAKLEAERLAVLDMADKIEIRRREVFLACFEKVQGHFERLFMTLFNGQGELRLSNPVDPLQSGLLIEARHKGDRVVNMDSMSGGEKTLTALAFLFAIQFYNPAPFYVFDEADAALDKENSGKLARLIKEISQQSQFIAITHNDNLINEADQIIGVALDKTKSSVLTLRVPRSKNP